MQLPNLQIRDTKHPLNDKKNCKSEIILCLTCSNSFEVMNIQTVKIYLTRIRNTVKTENI